MYPLFHTTSSWFHREKSTSLLASTFQCDLNSTFIFLTLQKKSDSLLSTYYLIHCLLYFIRTSRTFCNPLSISDSSGCREFLLILAHFRKATLETNPSPSPAKWYARILYNNQSTMLDFKTFIHNTRKSLRSNQWCALTVFSCSMDCKDCPNFGISVRHR